MNNSTAENRIVESSSRRRFFTLGLVLVATLIFQVFIIAAGSAQESAATAQYGGPQDYYFPWYDSQGGRTWILMAQPSAGSGAATDNYFDISYKPMNSQGGMVPMNTGGQMTVNPGETKYLLPNGKIGGPVKVQAGGIGLVSERSLFGSSFEEVWATSYDELDSHYWWPVYDNAYPGMQNWVLVANPPDSGETVTARINIYQNGSLVISDSRDIAPGSSWTPKYTGISGGPVEVTAWRQGGSSSNPADARKVIASQRVLYNGAFNEMPGIPA